MSADDEDKCEVCGAESTITQYTGWVRIVALEVSSHEEIIHQFCDGCGQHLIGGKDGRRTREEKEKD